MSGFPIRPTRSAYGPKPQNRRPVRNPSQEMDGPTVADLLMWQVAGCGIMTAVAMVVVPTVSVNGVVAGGSVVNSEAWNSNKDQAAPVVTRTALGILTVQYAATYPDKDGIAQTTNLVAGLPMAQGLGVTGHLMAGCITKVDGRTFQVDLLRTDTLAHDDCAFACWFW